MLRRLAVLALALAVAACGSDDGPDIASPDQLELRIVSGDGQRAPVADAGGSVSAAFVPIQAMPDNILPEPLVARITVDGQAPSASVAPSGPLGPNLAVLPPNTVVTFRTIQPEGVGTRHCGSSFVDAGIPDDSGYVVTYWERGTYAGTCRTEVRLIVDGVPRVDTVFTATFEPGPVARASWTCHGWKCDTIARGDTIDLHNYVTDAVDAHGNPIPAETLATRPAAWAWYGEGIPVPDAPTGYGWTTVVPAQGHGIALWIEGVYVGGRVFAIVP